jgi:hypothetical protein
VYLFAEPTELAGRTIPATALAAHRAEVQSFAERVADSEVTFHWASYSGWLSTWDVADMETADHGRRLSSAFAL